MGEMHQCISSNTEKMLRATQSEGIQSPQGSFRRNIRTHSTPLMANGANSSNRSTNSNKKRARKRKLVDSSDDVIDLTPKKLRVPSNDSDVEIIEPEPPIIIDLVSDDTHNCSELTAVNPTAEIATTSDSQENESTIYNDTANVVVDSSASTELVDTSIETQNVIETEHQASIEVAPLYIIDKDVNGVGSSSLKTPLYDLVSDDSFCFDSPFATPVSSQDYSQNKTLTNNADDSVVFVSETIQTPKRVPTSRTTMRVSRADDFIPINHRGGFHGFQQKKNERSPKGKVQKKRSPKSTQIRHVNPVTATQTSPKPQQPPSGIKRMVLIDGNNVAFGHGRNRDFSVEGIDICLKYFLENGYDARAIVPQMRLKKSKSSNQDLLAKLENDGLVVFSPCKNLPNGKKVTSYDDRFILDFAADYDAAVISNDNYRDLSKESEKYRDIINTRVIGFTFLNDIIRFPQDPYGKDGPSLNDILNGKQENKIVNL